MQNELFLAPQLPFALTNVQELRSQRANEAKSEEDAYSVATNQCWPLQGHRKSSCSLSPGAEQPGSLTWQARTGCSGHFCISHK